MAQVVTISVGRLLGRNEKLTTAKFNAIVKSIVISLSGITGTAEIGDGAVTPAKAGPGAWFYAAGALTATTYTAAYAPTPVASYADGLWLTFKADAANPALAEFDGGAGAKPLYKNGGRARLDPGDIAAGSIVTVRYNTTLVAGGCWEVMSLLALRPVDYPFQPASAFVAGQQGLVPAPPASAVRLYLGSDGIWRDVLAEARTYTDSVANQANTYLEIYKSQTFV